MQRSPISRGFVIEQSTLATNTVIRNTYMLLAMTLLFSAATALFALKTNASPSSAGFLLLMAFGLQYITYMLRNSAWGIVTTFAFTGFLGYSLGPVLNMYLQLANGAQLVTAALGLTGAIFFALSGYALTTRKDFSYLSGFLIAGATVAFLASLIGLFFNIPALHLAISSAFVLISAGFILYETSEIIHGGQTNYILATISLYVQVFNLFVSLLRLLSAFSNNRE